MTSTQVGPTLVTGMNEAKVRQYSHMVESVCPVRTVYPESKAFAQEGGAFDVAVVYRQDPNVSDDDGLSEFAAQNPQCQIAMVTAIAPDGDLTESPVDLILTEPVDESTLHQRINSLNTRARYRSLLEDWAAIAPQASLLDSEVRPGDHEATETHRRLRAEFQRLQAEMDDIATTFDADDFEALFRSL